MNYNDDDELERMRARSRRPARRSTADSRPDGRSGAAKAPRSAGAYRAAGDRQVPPRRNVNQSSRTRNRYEEDDFYDEEFGQEEYGRNDYADDGYSRETYGYGSYDDPDDAFDDIMIDDEPDYSYTDRRASSRSPRTAGNASGSASTRGSSSRTRNARTGRQTADQDRSGQRRQRDDVYMDNNGRNRAASGRRNQGQMAKKKKKKGLKSILLILLAACIAYGAWLFIHRPTGIWNIAVFGVDSRDGNTKNALADVQMICSIDRSTGEIRLVSVYRDTYLKINSEGTYHKINEAYFKGGQKQAVAALEENLDLKIDDYATFNWKSVAEAINILGGIDIDITPAEFKYINAFITETVESTGIGSVQLAQAGPNHLDGVQAVAYSRLRLMDTDFQRTERQRKVVMLALEKAKQADVSTLTSLVTYMIPQISTSVGVNDVVPLVKDVKKYHIGETAGFPFSRQTMRVGRMDCVIPTTLESNVILLHQFLYGEDVSYSPSSAVKKISAHISEETGLYEEGKVAPSGGNSSGGSSGGSGSSGQAPVQTAPAETPPETTMEESTEESTAETTESDDPAEETRETDETEEIGPGVSTSPAKDPDSTKATTAPEEAGPGVDNTTKPTEKPTQPETTRPTESPSPGNGPGGGSNGSSGSQGNSSGSSGSQNTPGGSSGSQNNSGSPSSGPEEAGPGA